MKKILIFLVSLNLIHCKKETTEHATPQVKYEKKAPENQISNEDIKYFEFKPDSISNVNLKGFNVISSFYYHGNKFVTGNYAPLDGKIVKPDSETDYGKRLLVLNNKNEVIFKGRGSGDTFQYWPKFYRNKSNDKVIIVCQMAFEYFFGGEAFLLENNKVRYIGNLDIESDDMEKSLTDIINIEEANNDIIFSFKSDSLLLKPGSDDILIPNNNVRYIYNNSQLTMKR
ncbi:hypothetical protein ACFQO9_10950 [Chryseobacterium zhengzhouense]|uniref:Uncharacterized protein n=2 Tax=Chryseobacterium TaxID=59732 RepID=A0ABW2LXC2_9FLAO